MQKNTSPSDLLNKKVALYTAIAGTLCSAAAMADPMQSSWSGYSRTVNEQDSYDYPEIDIDGDGEADFSFNIWWSGPTHCDQSTGNSYLYGLNGSTMLTDDDGYGGMISSGTSVPGALFPVDYYLNFASCSLATDFAPNESGYAGFQFYIGKSLHYGYMRVGTTESDTEFTTTLHEVCYETTPGKSIRAGDCRTTGVPVGGLIPLSLGVLALGAGALRRRRKHLN